VVRLALRAFLTEDRHGKSKSPSRARRLIGSLESGVPDLAERHRQYILASLKRGR
jgi:hypothetical protein